MSGAMDTSGARPPRNRSLRVLFAALGGLALCVCIACGGFSAFAVLRDDNATATPVAVAAQATSIPTARATSTLAVAATGATPTAAPVVVSGCGGGSVSLGSDRQLRADLDQWNRIVDHANVVTRGWNAYLTATNDLSYTQAAGNPVAIAASDTFLGIAQAELPALRNETTSGRFAKLAAEEVATIEAEVAFVTLYRQAVSTSDKDVWNRAIDASDATDTARASLQAEIDRQCEFWRSRR